MRRDGIRNKKQDTRLLQKKEPVFTPALDHCLFTGAASHASRLITFNKNAMTAITSKM